MLSVPGKVFASIVLSRLRDGVEIAPSSTDCYSIQFTVVLVIVGFLFASYIKFPTVVEEVLYYCPIAFYDILCFMILSLRYCAGCVLGLILVHLAVAYVSYV